MEKISNKEDQLKKLREKKQTKEKKRFKQKERKLEEMIEKLPKKQINNHFMGKKEKKKLKKKILAKKIKSDEGQIVKIVKLSERENLDGRILGCVKEITDWGLIIELPNFLSASVHITEISDVYSDLLEKYSNGTVEEIPELSDLFSIGDLVVAKILECVTNNLGQKQIKASLNPHHVNEMYINTTLETGLVLPACVHSKEDHGYLLDVGVKNTRVFIKYDSVSKPLFLGQIVTCMISKIKVAASMSILEVTLDEELIRSANRLSPSQVSLLNLVPGMKVIANICQQLPHGWKAKLKNTQFKAFISPEAMSTAYNAKYLTNKRVDLDCSVLYVCPRHFHVYLSCNEALLERQTGRPEFSVGCFVQNGKITRVEPSGVYFHCEEDNIRGFVSQWHGGCKPELFQAKFQAGEVIKECRIIDYRIASTAEVNLGDEVSCVVKGISVRGVIAQVGYYKLKATCENEYVEGNKEDIKVGDEVQAKVIRINSEQNSIEVAFKSLYRIAQPLTSVKHTKPGRLVWGVLKEKLPGGVRVEFGGDISGVFPTSAMSQIICQILKYEDGELLLTEADEKLHKVKEPNHS
ncbi:hypothetical protein M8J75_015757 [Diaphorina citri]|nr:hypothetical protein M8J75_015757 [Diaphorina citri]